MSTKNNLQLMNYQCFISTSSEKCVQFKITYVHARISQENMCTVGYVLYMYCNVLYDKSNIADHPIESER